MTWRAVFGWAAESSTRGWEISGTFGLWFRVLLSIFQFCDYRLLRWHHISHCRRAAARRLRSSQRVSCSSGAHVTVRNSRETNPGNADSNFKCGPKITGFNRFKSKSEVPSGEKMSAFDLGFRSGLVQAGEMSVTCHFGLYQQGYTYPMDTQAWQGCRRRYCGRRKRCCHTPPTKQLWRHNGINFCKSR
jgi:hypothetical protein